MAGSRALGDVCHETVEERSAIREPGHRVMQRTLVFAGRALQRGRDGIGERFGVDRFCNEVRDSEANTLFLRVRADLFSQHHHRHRRRRRFLPQALQDRPAVRIGEHETEENEVDGLTFEQGLRLGGGMSGEDFEVRRAQRLSGNVERVLVVVDDENADNCVVSSVRHAGPDSE